MHMISRGKTKPNNLNLEGCSDWVYNSNLGHFTCTYREFKCIIWEEVISNDSAKLSKSSESKSIWDGIIIGIRSGPEPSNRQGSILFWMRERLQNYYQELEDIIVDNCIQKQKDGWEITRHIVHSPNNKQMCALSACDIGAVSERSYSNGAKIIGIPKIYLHAFTAGFDNGIQCNDSLGCSNYSLMGRKVAQRVFNEQTIVGVYL